MKSMEIIFLTYVNRSGSTYLANILSGSDNILVCPEADVLVRELLEDPLAEAGSSGTVMDRLNPYLKLDNKLSSWDLPQLKDGFCDPGARNIDVFVLLLDYYRNLVKPTASKILFKAERLVFLIDKLATLNDHRFSFQFISIVRDPRAVYYSQQKTRIPESGKWMSKNPVFTGIYWGMHNRLAMKLTRELSLFIVKYEDLVQQFIPVMDALIEFLNIPAFDYNPEKRDLPDRMPENHRDIHKQINQKPLEDKLNDWANSLNRKDVVLIETVTESVMQSMDYLPVSKPGSRLRYIPVVWLYRFMFHCRAVVHAVIFRFRRMFRWV